MRLYHHRQPARTMWLVMGLTLVLIAILTGSFALFTPAGNRGAFGWVLLLVVALMAFAGWLFGALTVTVDESRIVIAFGPGWPRKTIPLTQVRGAGPVRNRWWYGWGIRLTPHGWLWNVSGLDAVEVELSHGRCLRIGTDEPQELTAAIRQASGL